MGYSCPQSLYGIQVRITRLDACGRSLDPMVPNSRIQFAAFTTLGMKPDLQKGADTTVVNAAGQICIRDKDCDRLKGFDATLDLCGVPLPALEMLLDAQLLTDADGNFKGAVLRNEKDGPCPGPKMIEVWSKDGNRAQCVGIDGVSRPFTQWLAPFTKNWSISGDLAFEYSKPLTVSLTGYMEENPNWVPSWPGATFPSYVPGGGDPTGIPTGAAPTVLPSGIVADTWTLADATAIKAGGPLAWQSVTELPTAVECNYAGVQSAS